MLISLLLSSWSSGEIFSSFSLHFWFFKLISFQRSIYHRSKRWGSTYRCEWFSGWAKCRWNAENFEGFPICWKTWRRFEICLFFFPGGTYLSWMKINFDCAVCSKWWKLHLKWFLIDFFFHLFWGWEKAFFYNSGYAWESITAFCCSLFIMKALFSLVF